MPQSFPVHEKCHLPGASSTAVFMTSEALDPIWSVNANSEVHAPLNWVAEPGTLGTAALGTGALGTVAVGTGTGVSIGTGALGTAAQTYASQAATLASQDATSASNAATSASNAATSATQAAIYLSGMGTVNAGGDSTNSLNQVMPTAAAWDKITPISTYPNITGIPTSTLTIGTLINSNSILDVLKKNHETKIGNLPAEIIFKAIKEHVAGNEEKAGPQNAAAMEIDCNLAELTTGGFSFAISDASGFQLHLYQGGKVFTRQANGDLIIGGLVYCDPKKEQCSKENEKKKLLIEIVKDISMNHFFDKIKNIVQHVCSNNVLSDKGFNHRVVDAITSKKMLVSQMRLSNGQGFDFGHLVAYTEFEFLI